MLLCFPSQKKKTFLSLLTGYFVIYGREMSIGMNLIFDLSSLQDRYETLSEEFDEYKGSSLEMEQVSTGRGLEGNY